MFKTVFQDAARRTYYDLPSKNRPAAWEKDGNDKAQIDDAKNEFFVGAWRTYQISGHCPMWAELKVDFADAYLARLG